MIRVIQVLARLDFGGAESFVMNVYRAIDRSQVQFDFIKHTEEIGDFEPEIQALGGRVYACPRYNGRNHFAYCRWWNQFFEGHPEYKVIHGHVRSTAAVYLHIANQHGLTTISHSHSTSNGSGFSAVVKNIMQLPIRYTADYLFACSREAGKWLFGSRAITKENYRMIPNGIDLKRFTYSENSRRKIRKELSMENAFVLGHVGRLTQPKNHSFLLDVFAEFLKKKPEARLLLVGDGPLREPLRQKCGELGITDKVCFAGAKTNTEQYYSAMDVFVFPSLWEGLPVSVVEAQASGLPCLISDTITGEVRLTHLVKTMTLSAGPSEWAKKADDMSVCGRAWLSESESESISAFDIMTVSKDLEKFYCAEMALSTKSMRA